MPPASIHSGKRIAEDTTPGGRQNDLSVLARDLVDKVGIEGAIRYCHSLGWLGVLRQVELLKYPRA